MKRRQLLQLSLALSLTGGALLTGCGGGSSKDDASGPPLVETRGTVTLPSGYSVPLTELIGTTAFDGAALQTDGSFITKRVEGSAPQLAFLAHAATQKLSLLGFVGEGMSGISAKGTATALLYLSMGLGGLPAPQQKEAVLALEAHPAVMSLADTIAARTAANPYAVLESDPQIVAVLKRAFETLTKKGTRAAQAVAKTRAEPAPVLSLTPGDQSLARVVQTDLGTSVIPTNLGRRPAVAYTYRTGTENSAGQQTMLSAAVRVNGPQELPAVTTWVGSAFSLGNLSAWAPVPGQPVALTLQEGSTKTFYETVMVMASGKTEAEGEPAFFAEPRYARELATWRTDRERLNKHAWVSGIFFDLVKSAIGGAATALSATVVASLVAELEAIEAAAANRILAQAAIGAFGNATKFAMESFLRGDLLSGNLKNLAYKTVQRSLEAGQAAVRQRMDLALARMASLALGVLAAAGTLLALGDLLTTYSDVMASEKGARWNATLLKPTLQLSPDVATIASGESLRLSVNPVGLLESATNLTYRWSVDHTLAVLSEVNFTGSPNVGRQIETRTKVVTLETTPSTEGTLTVRVQAFQGATLFGEASSRITARPGALSLRASSLDVGDLSHSTAPRTFYPSTEFGLSYPQLSVSGGRTFLQARLLSAYQAGSSVVYDFLSIQADFLDSALQVGGVLTGAVVTLSLGDQVTPPNAAYRQMIFGGNGISLTIRRIDRDSQRKIVGLAVEATATLFNGGTAGRRAEIVLNNTIEGIDDRR
jgi:hypothetical protein